MQTLRGHRFQGYVSNDGDVVIMVGRTPLPLKEFLQRTGLSGDRDDRAAETSAASYHGGRADASAPTLPRDP